MRLKPCPGTKIKPELTDVVDNVSRYYEREVDLGIGKEWYI